MGITGMKGLDRWHIGGIIAVVMLGVVMFALAQVIYSQTLARWWIPVLLALIPTAAFIPLCRELWSRLLKTRGFLPCLGMNVVLFFPMFYLLVLGMNSWFASDSGRHTERVEVADKYSKQHQRYRRVSRRTRIPDGYTTSYHLLLRFADGRTKEQQVDFTLYRRARMHSMRELEVDNGLFGWKVIRTQSNRIKNQHR